MKQKGFTSALLLLASACLVPQPAAAVEGIRSIEVVHFGEGIDAVVDITPAEGRMHAVPYVKFSGPRVETQPSANGRDGAGILKKVLLPDGNPFLRSVQESKEISFSRGSRLFREAKDALKGWKRQNAGTEKNAEMAKEGSDNIGK